MISTMYTRLLQLSLLSLVITLALGINYLSAWTGPSALPPGNNASAPLNVGTATQVKDGNVGVGSSTNNVAGVNPVGFSVLGSQYINGWLKVGDNAVGLATQPLELVGTPGVDGIKFPDGSVQVSAALGGGGKLTAIRQYTASATWTKPAGLSYVVVEVWGGGGGGSGNNSGPLGGTGGTSNFGSYVSATGGINSTSGGSGVGGNINLVGGDGAGVTVAGPLGSQFGGSGMSGPIGGSAPRGGGTSRSTGKVPGGGGAGAGWGNAGGVPFATGMGGSAGGYAQKLIDQNTLLASESVVVGIGGPATAAAPGAAGMVIVYEYQ